MKKQRIAGSSEAASVSERRRSARLKQRSLESSLGPVIDLSRTGLCVYCTRKLRGTVEVTLFSRNGPHLQVLANVVWSRRIGFRKHIAGLEFVDTSPNAVRELARIGTAS